MPKQPRLPLAPLKAATRINNNTTLALALGVSRDVVVAQQARGLTYQRADEWAIRLGLHPTIVWGHDYDGAAA